MPINASFESDTCSFNVQNTSGYRISAGFSPQLGFQGNFYVYLLQHVAANRPLAEVPTGTEGLRPRGKLKLQGEQRSYEFREIDLVSTHTIVTRRDKLRWIELQYDPVISDTQKLPAVLSKGGDAALQEGELLNAYRFKLDDDLEHLYGESALQLCSGATVLRQVSVSSGPNSWLQKVVELNDGRATSANGHMPDFVLGRSSGDMTLNATNLAHLFVEESYADCLAWPSPELESLVGNLQAGASPAEHQLPGLSALDHVLRELNGRFQSAPRAESLEVATLVFRPNVFRDLALT